MMNTRESTIKVLLAVMGVMLMASCASTMRVEPDTESDILIIGQLVLKVENHKSKNGLPLNGIYHSGIELTFNDRASGEETVVKTRGAEGLFYFFGMKGSEYELTKLYYRKENASGAWSDIWLNLNDLSFSTDLGRVFNLGEIEWNFDFKKNTYVDQIQAYSSVENAIRERYSESRWNDFVFEETRLE